MNTMAVIASRIDERLAGNRDRPAGSRECGRAGIVGAAIGELVRSEPPARDPLADTGAETDRGDRCAHGQIAARPAASRSR